MTQITHGIVRKMVYVDSCMFSRRAEADLLRKILADLGVEVADWRTLKPASAITLTTRHEISNALRTQAR